MFTTLTDFELECYTNFELIVKDFVTDKEVELHLKDFSKTESAKNRRIATYEEQ